MRMIVDAPMTRISMTRISEQEVPKTVELVDIAVTEAAAYSLLDSNFCLLPFFQQGNTEQLVTFLMQLEI